MLLSLVIPVFNEEESLEKLLAEIMEVAEANRYDLDVIFVDDGSSDTSWQIIERLAAEHPQVRGIKFRRNFGKAAALDAGFQAVRGDYVMTLDADLQDDPHEIPAFLAQLEEQQLDLISGWKKKRHDPWHKVLPSRVFNYMISKMTGVWLHDHNCGMKCYRAEVTREIKLYGELHRFVPVLAHARGFKVGEKVIQHRSRKFGQSKYGFERFIKGYLDLQAVTFVTGYGKRPLHLAGTIGIITGGLGTLILAFLAFMWCFSRAMVGLDVWGEEMIWNIGHRPLLLYGVALMLFGAQVASLGIMCELMVAYHKEDACDYAISKEVGEKDEA